MAEEPTAPAAPEAPTAPTGEDATAPAPTTQDKAPKWDGDFDPDRAATLVAKLRQERDGFKTERDALAAKMGEKEDAEKSEFQRLQERAEKAERALKEAETSLLRAKVAKEHSIPEDLVGFLTGETEEEMKARAESLSAFVKAPADDVQGKPKPALTPGHNAPPEAEFDPEKVAAAARRY